MKGQKNNKIQIPKKKKELKTKKENVNNGKFTEKKKYKTKNEHGYRKNNKEKRTDQLKINKKKIKIEKISQKNELNGGEKKWNEAK